MNCAGRLIALAAIGLFAPGALGTIVYNPDVNSGTYSLVSNFESGTLAGFSSPFGGGQFVITTTAIAGNFSVRTATAVSTSGPGYATLTNVSVTPGASYVISALLNRGNLTSGNLYVDLNDIANDPELVIDMSTAGNQFIYKTFTAPTSFVTLRLVRDGTRTTSDLGYIDNVAITPAGAFVPASPIPEPALVALLPVGLMAGSRRRR